MKILIVEDDFVSRKLMTKFLNPIAECDVAVDGHEAISAFFEGLANNKERYDLVCLDVMMPKIDGMEVLKMIRNAEERHGIGGLDGVKIIMTTSVDSGKEILGAFRAGCEAYLTKPIDRNKLLETISKLGIQAD